MEKILVGNGFPMNLLRREVSIMPVDICEFRKKLKSVGVLSFWGHENTIGNASDFIGADLTPPQDRPVIGLDDEGYPFYHGKEFRQCYILSADYVANFRPAVGEEVSADKIKGWTVLKIEWV
ncbi:MAG: hypothetical protein JW808_07305 [Victivallales bacterium]|nr:hypothetical protein [Victivallales bacterium]